MSSQWAAGVYLRTMHKPKMLCLVQPGQQYVLYLALHTLGLEQDKHERR